MKLCEKDFCQIMKQLGLIEGVILSEEIKMGSADAVMSASEIISEILWEARYGDDSQQIGK